MAATAIDIVRRLAPSAKKPYVQAFEDPGDLLAKAGITTPLRLAHFLAQCFHETGALSILVESGRYTAKNLATMWDAGNWHRYFASRDACIAMAQQCSVDGGVALFNRVYGGRMGNGDEASGDGWRFRGRGILQTTGRYSYRRYGERCGVAFETDPDLVVDAAHALKPALYEWTDKHLNTAADANDIKVITRAINGGYVGLPGRKAWFARIYPIAAGNAPVEQSREWRVQTALVARGYDIGPVDGVIGPRSRLAIIAFREGNGLLPGAVIDTPLLQALGL